MSQRSTSKNVLFKSWCQNSIDTTMYMKTEQNRRGPETNAIRATCAELYRTSAKTNVERMMFENGQVSPKGRCHCRCLPDFYHNKEQYDSIAMTNGRISRCTGKSIAVSCRVSTFIRVSSEYRQSSKVMAEISDQYLPRDTLT